MPGYRFSVGTKFRLDGVTYEVTTLLADQQVNLERVGTGEVLTESKSKLITAFAKGELEFIPKGVGKGKGRKQGEGGTQGQAGSQEDRQVFATLDQYPEYAQRVAQYRLEAIKPLVALGPAARTRSAVRTRSEELRQAQAAATDTLAGFPDYDLEGGAAKAKTPKRKRSGRSLMQATDVASLFRWLKLYLDSDRDIRSLVPDLYRQSEWNRVPAEVDQAIDEVIRERYLVPEKTSGGTIYNLVAARISELNAENPGRPPFKRPSRSTVERRIATLDPIAVYTARFGERAARLRFRQYFEGPRPNLPQVRVEIDSTHPDLILVDDEGRPIGRPWLTACIDVYTRYPLGYCLSWEYLSYLTVMQCLCHAILDKGNVRERYGLQNDWLGYGVPILLVTDRGREYVGSDLVAACGLLGVKLEYCPPRTPYYKGTIERGWRTWATQLFHTLPGTTFSNIAERGEYDSVGRACVRASDIDRLLHIYFIDIYAQQEHRTPEGPKLIPARAWERALADGWEPRLPESARQVRIALAANIERTVEHYGIDLFGLRYNCDELGPLRAILNGVKARVKYDASNLGFIYVYDPSINDYLEVPAMASWAAYATGKSLWQHRVIRRQALRNGDRADAGSLGMAERQIWSIVDAARTTKAGHGTKVTRFKAGGAPLSELESGLKPKPNTEPRLISPASTVAPPPHPPILDSQPIQTSPHLAPERAVPSPSTDRPHSLASKPMPATADDFLTLDVDDDGWEVGTRQAPNSW